MCFECLKYAAGHGLPRERLIKVQINLVCCSAATAGGGAASPGTVRRSVGLCSGRSPRNGIHPKNRVQREDEKLLLLLLHKGISLNKKSTLGRDREVPFINDLLCPPPRKMSLHVFSLMYEKLGLQLQSLPNSVQIFIYYKLSFSRNLLYAEIVDVNCLLCCCSESQ